MERSCTNEHEAERAFRLACFFIAQGIAPSQITILAAYQAQASLIKGGDFLPLTLGDVWRLGVRLVLFCSPSSESILVLDCGMKAALTSMESSDKLWMETCSFTYMYGSDVLMYYALFSYTVRVCSYYISACSHISDIPPWWFCWQEKWRKTWRSSCRSKAWRESWKRWRSRLTLDWWSAAMSWTSPMPHVAKNVLSLLSKRPAIFSMGASDMSGCSTEWICFYIHRSTFRYLTHVVRASYSDDIFQLSLNQKVHIL